MTKLQEVFGRYFLEVQGGRAVRVFKRAIEIYEKNDWCKYAISKENPHTEKYGERYGFCLTGVVYTAAEQLQYSPEPYAQILDAIVLDEDMFFNEKHRVTYKSKTHSFTSKHPVRDAARFNDAIPFSEWSKEGSEFAISLLSRIVEIMEDAINDSRQ